MTSHELDRIAAHRSFLQHEIARNQDEIRETDARYCRALREFRKQQYQDPPIQDRPF